MKMYALKDVKAGTFMNPWPESGDPQAIRNLTSAVNGDTGQQISQFAEDFDMYYLGEFDQDTGLFLQGNEEPKFIIHASQLKQVNNGKA